VGAAARGTTRGARGRGKKTKRGKGKKVFVSKTPETQRSMSSQTHGRNDDGRSSTVQRRLNSAHGGVRLFVSMRVGDSDQNQSGFSRSSVGCIGAPDKHSAEHHPLPKRGQAHSRDPRNASWKMELCYCWSRGSCPEPHCGFPFPA
jgi:hypothetical protein